MCIIHKQASQEQALSHCRPSSIPGPSAGESVKRNMPLLSASMQVADSTEGSSQEWGDVQAHC